jgi:hypothetical protein
MWTVDLVKEILAGTADPNLIREADRKGLNAVTFAALKAAAQADSLAPLLQLLDPPDREETTQLDKVVTLLEAIAESQGRLERRLARLESALAARSST